MGVLELHVVTALSTKVSTLANRFNKMAIVLNKQQAQPVQHVQAFCDVCGEGYMSNLCPENLEDVCFVGNANRGSTNL